MQHLSALACTDSYLRKIIAMEITIFTEQNLDVFSQNIAENVLLTMLKCGNPNIHRVYEEYSRRFTDSCISLIEKVGPSSLRHLQKSWEKAISLINLGKVLMEFRKSMERNHPNKSDFASLLMKYLAAEHLSAYHGSKDHRFLALADSVAELVAVFTYGDENYTKAVSIISENACNFPPNILFDIACKNIKQKLELDGNKRARRTVIREEVAMLESYVKRSDCVPEDKLDWLCKVFGRVSGTSNISHLASIFQNCSDTDMLLTLFMKIEQLEVKSRFEKSKLLEVLFMLYEKYFLELRWFYYAGDWGYLVNVNRAKEVVAKLGGKSDLLRFDAILAAVEKEAANRPDYDD